MGKRNYKVSESIDVKYQAAGVATGATVTMEIYDESGAKDGVNFPDVTMVEIGVSGRYTGSLTPDAIGDWSVHISDDSGGKAIKHFSVGSYNVHSVGTNLATLDSKVDTIDGKVDSIDVELDSLTNPPMIG